MCILYKSHRQKSMGQSGMLKRQPGDFPPCFSEENNLIPQLAFLYLPVKLAFMPTRLRMASSSACLTVWDS
jgi:hypothetical protein